MTNDLNGQQPGPVVAGELGQLFQPKLPLTMLASVRYGEQTRMAGMWWEPTYKPYS